MLELWRAIRYRNTFRGIEAFCLFIGYPRSGHSLIGALLDAHPNVIVSHEAHALKLVKENATKASLFTTLLHLSRRQAGEGRQAYPYSYAVKGQYQGFYTELKIIGDKRGEGSALELHDNPHALDDLAKLIEKPLKLIHVNRNPFDAISTHLMRRNVKRQQPINAPTLQQEIEAFFLRANAILLVTKQQKFPLFELPQRDFLLQPEEKLRQLCAFLNVAPIPDYIAAACSIVDPEPNHSRHRVDLWTPQLITNVEAKLAQYPFYRGYRFDN